MAPYSPAIGLSLAHESQAPPPPKLSTRLLTSLANQHTTSGPDERPIQVKARKLSYADPSAHPLTGFTASRRWPAISTIFFSVLLFMIIGLSSATYQHEHTGREQSLAEMVKTTYFERDVPVASYEGNSDILVSRDIYLVREVSADAEANVSRNRDKEEGSNAKEEDDMEEEMEMEEGGQKEPETEMETEMDMRKEKRDDDPAVPAPTPDAGPAPPIVSSSESATPTSSVRPSPTPSKTKNFRDPDDVRDPSAVKHDHDEEYASDSEPSEMAKRHWSSRYRRISLARQDHGITK